MNNKPIKDSKSFVLLNYYNNDDLCSVITVDYINEEVTVKNYTENVVKRAFGNNISPSFEDYNNFLKDRCMPETRAGLRNYLDYIGVDSYEPFEIIKKTQGRMAEDQQWLEIKELI